ncbi:MAG TPA: hypothetical protein VID73_09570 [Ktedonobacterales bacterium]|jgi:hypothetical protein
MLPAASFLDQLVDRFRHRWETNRQYRAAFSGVVGLVVLIALCSCAGIVSSVTNRVLATSGFNSNNSVGPLGGGGGPALQGAAHFPTETVPAWQPGQVPNGPPVPNSGTPIPTPTHPPTPTTPPSPSPFPTQPGGGGGGGGYSKTCSGAVGNSTWKFTPCPVVAGQQFTLTVSAPSFPNAAFANLLIGAGCNSYTFGPYDGQLNGAGMYVYSNTMFPGAANCHTPLGGSMVISGGPGLIFSGPPVQ